MAHYAVANNVKLAGKLKVFSKAAELTGAVLQTKGFRDFIHFNLEKTPKADDETYGSLTPYHLPYKIERRLSKLAYQKGWETSDELILALNLPSHKRLDFAPFNFKYVFDHVKLFGTVDVSENLSLPDEVLLKPLKSQREFVEHFLLL